MSFPKKPFFSIFLSVFISAFLVFLFAFASNIDTTYHWAWNDVIGWIDFSYDDVNISDSVADGYVNSSIGIISLSCGIGGNPDGVDYCSTSDYKVLNDGNGNLSGWAWNDTIGWISFYCGDLNLCGTSNYRVTIDDEGYFHGWAWNDQIGWISFNCQEPDICSTSDYKVKLNWTYPTQGSLTSVIYDTQREDGATLTGVVWQGEMPAGTNVQFELGSSNSTSTDSFVWTGPYSSTVWKTDWWQVSVPIADLQYHNNHRYIRYKVILTPDDAHQYSPVIYDIILKWAR